MAAVDRRSDVFGLGAVLCNLLTGRPPYLGSDAASTRALAARAKLSDAFARLGGCGAEPELVALCKRCLSAEPADRPADAGEVAESVAALRRAADDRARRAEVDRERAAVREAEGRKRRRVLAASAGAVLAVFALGAGLAGWQAWRATAAERQALFDRDRAQGAETRAVEGERKGEAARLRAEWLKTEAEEAARRAVIAATHARNSEQQARAAEVEASERRQAEQKAKMHAIGLANRLATLTWQIGRVEESIPLFEELLKLTKTELGEVHPESMRVVANLGVSYKDVGQLHEAVPLLEQAYRARTEYTTLRWVGEPLSDAYARAGRPADAARVAGEVLSDARRTLKPDSPELGGLLASAGKQLLALDPAAAEQVLRECLALREKLAPNVWATANAKSLRGDALLLQKKYADAEPLLRTGYAGLVADGASLPPAARPNLGEAADRLVRLYRAVGKADEAARWRDERAKHPPEVAPRPRPVR